MAKALSERVLNQREKKRGFVSYSTDPKKEVTKTYLKSISEVIRRAGKGTS